MRVIIQENTKEGGIFMSLIKCDECGKEISDQAKNCPHCGFPIQKSQVSVEVSQNSSNKRPKKKRKGLKVVFSIVAVFFIIGMIGNIFGGNEDTEIPENSNEEKIYLTDEEIPQMFSDPDSFKGKYVKLSGRVFSDPEVNKEFVGLQIWNNPENNERNFLVKAPQDNVEYTSDSYVIVDGKIEGRVKGSNLLGGKVVAPLIVADSVELSNYKDVVRPTLKEVSFDSVNSEQYGYSVAITSIELAEKETRVYLTVKNNGGSKFNIFEYSSKLIQNGKQYETEFNFNADYPKLQSDTLPGTETSGVWVFPAVERDEAIQLYIEGYSENWEEDIQPYQFDIEISE